jgi:hypothetical protein
MHATVAEFIRLAAAAAAARVSMQKGKKEVNLDANSGFLKGRLHCVRFWRKSADGSVFPSVIAQISTP